MSFAYAKPADRLGTIPTPPEVAQFLFNLIRPIVKPKIVLDPCVGDGNLIRPWIRKHTTIGIDVREDCKPPVSTLYAETDFVTWHPLWFEKPQLVLCNPPFNGHKDKKHYPEVFLRRIIELFGAKVPIVLAVPMGFRLNQRRNSKRWHWLKSTIEISSIISCPIDLYENTEFHTEILLFNIRKVKPHYWLDL